MPRTIYKVVLVATMHNLFSFSNVDTFLQYVSKHAARSRSKQLIDDHIHGIITILKLGYSVDNGTLKKRLYRGFV